MAITIREAANSKFDLLALGECMVRLAPPAHGRIEFAKTLEVDVGGGEFNVAYACARLGLRAGFVSKLPNNPVARIILNHARAIGMSVEHVRLEKYDGIGRACRVGVNFTEVGAGVRGGMTMYDRGHSSASQITPEDFDWADIFSRQGVRWFHTGGIFASLSKECARAMKSALTAAKASGAVTSFDFNFRSALWSDDKAETIRRDIAPLVDVLIGNEQDLFTILGNKAANTSEPTRETFRAAVETFRKQFPNIQAVATTRRQIKSGLLNHFSGILWSDGRIFEARGFQDLEIEDRIGAGDGFSSGVAYAFISGMQPQDIVDFAVAQGALLHTTRGDTSQVTVDEVLYVMKGGSPRIQR